MNKQISLDNQNNPKIESKLTVNHDKWDCIILGGGLAGSLFFYALRKKQPELKVLLIEKDSSLGGNKTWSFHETDLPNNCDWIRPLISKTWNSYEVIFPKYKRLIESPYHSIKSDDLSEKILKEYSESILLNTYALSFDRQNVNLNNGDIYSATEVIDCTGWKAAPEGPFGYQKFIGLDIKTKSKHGLTYPILKDASVPQTDGYRFFYVLPWSDDELLVEDTYYSNSPELDSETIKKEILAYTEKRWSIHSILRSESGSLRLPLNTNLSIQNSDKNISIGASSEIYQPVTGYTFPETILRVHLLTSSNISEWKNTLSSLIQKQKGNQTYLRILNRMLFLAAEPKDRYKVLERFYTFSPELISRFYKGQLLLKDKVRILCGKPPVKILKAIKSIFFKT